MIVCMIRKLVGKATANPALAAALTGAFSAVSLAGAYISQYGFGLVPCMLCHYQRGPHFANLTLGLLALLLLRRPKPARAVLLAAALSLLTGTGVAVYHVGVEQGIFHLDACAQATVSDDASFEEMKQLVMETPSVHCDKPQFVLFNISMAGWNALFSFAAFVFAVIALGRSFGFGAAASGSSGETCERVKGGCGRKPCGKR